MSSYIASKFPNFQFQNQFLGAAETEMLLHNFHNTGNTPGVAVLEVQVVIPGVVQIRRHPVTDGTAHDSSASRVPLSLSKSRICSLTGLGPSIL